MAYAPDVHVAVYQVLDDVIRADIVPLGAEATIHSVIDDLRIATAPAYMIQQAEGISLQLHHLERAVGQRDADRAANVRNELRSLAGLWLDQRIRH